jgi:hypothetical protein
MENLAGLGVALAAMWSDEKNPYDGYVMLSALPGAPTIDRPSVAERVRGFVRMTVAAFRPHYQIAPSPGAAARRRSHIADSDRKIPDGVGNL